MKLQEKINAGTVNKAPRICLYGVPGIGKTTLASQAPKAVIIPTEDGANYVQCDKLPLVKNYEELIEDVNMLLNEQHDYKTIVIDSVDWAEKLIERYIVSKKQGATCLSNAGEYGLGYRELIRLFDDLLLKLSRFSERGIMVLFTAHCETKTIPEPGYDEKKQYCIKLYAGSEKNPGGTASLLTEWVDCLWFYTRENGNIAGSNDKRNPRQIYTQNSSFSSGKNRWNMPDIVKDLEWDHLLSYYKKTLNRKEEN